MISRKIIIYGDLTDRNRIEIQDDEVIELPFYMIPADVFSPDAEKTSQLNQLVPTNVDDLHCMTVKHSKTTRKSRNDVLSKSFKAEEYCKIKEWLKDDN